MLFMTSCWSATLAANHVTGDWHTESLFKQEYAWEFQVHVLEKEIHCQTNELHVLCEVGMCKYSIQSTLISIIDWPWPRYPWQHSAFQLSSTFNTEKMGILQTYMWLFDKACVSVRCHWVFLNWVCLLYLNKQDYHVYYYENMTF